MPTRMLVGVDTRGLNPSVLAWIKQTCSRSDHSWEIELVTVTEIGWIPAGGPEVNYRDAYEQALWKAEETVRAMLPQQTVIATMLWGLPFPELVHASSRAHLLVLGSDKTGVIIGLISGTLPLRVAAHSNCPTVVVPASYSPRPPRVAVGVSLDHSDEIVLDFAAAEARRNRCALTVVHAVPFPRNLLIADLLSDGTYDAAAQESTRALGFAVKELTNRFPDVQVKSIVSKNGPVLGLLQAAAGASLLVVGSSGKGPLRGLILGSVSHDVLLNPPCPVAVVPNHEVVQ